jgi:L-rhamnose mutarotase
MKIKTLPLLGVALSLAACQSLPKAAPVFGPTNPSPAVASKAPVKSYASIIELRPEKEKLYRELHANVWPEIRKAITKSNIRNYNIYVTDIAGRRFLVAHFEYVGSNFDADMALIAKNPTMKDKWWPLTDPCQIRLPGTPDGQRWRSMEQLMHLD